jgi:hypothetical protein
MLARGEVMPDDSPVAGRLKNLLSAFVLVIVVSGATWLAGGGPRAVVAAALVALAVVVGVWILGKRRPAHAAADSEAPEY